MAPSQQMYLAEELMVKIFLLQPVNSLMRCRCVCKLWFRIISNQSFVNDYAKTSLNANKYLIFNHSYCYSLCLVNNTTCSDVKTLNREEYYIAKSFCGTAQSRVIIYGIRNGLLCLSDEPLSLDSPIYLWNPVVRKSKKLPDSSVSVNASGVYLCFGYDTDDYKVIKIVTTNVIKCLIFSIEVYSLNTNCWKIIYCDRHDFSHRSNPQLLRGALYFFNNEKNIASFDLTGETVREIIIPEEIVEVQTSTMEASEESIVLMDFYSRKCECLAMWVLKQDDEGFYLWEKKFEIEFEHGPRIGLNHKINVRSIDYVTLFFMWDFEMKKWKDVRFRHEQLNIFGIKTFKESITLLNETTSTKPKSKKLYKTTNPIPSSCMIHVGGQITFISAAGLFHDSI